MGNNTSSSSFDALPGCSKSTVVATADTETGSHVLTINGFSKIALGIGKSINSGTFTVGGHSWYIAFFPEGAGRDDFSHNYGKCVSIFVYLDQPRTYADVKARFQLNLLRPNGKPISWGNIRSEGPFILLGLGTPRWGRQNYMHRTEFLSHLLGDRIQIRCDVTVVSDTRLESTTSRSLAVPPPDLHRHLGHLLESRVGADVTFLVRGELFAAHKAVLATRSSVFMAELFGGNMKEKATSRVQIDDMEPSVFRAMLHFVYTDSLPKMEQKDTVVMAQHLLVAADKYSFERLKLMCENRLCSHIDLKTVATTMSLAERHGCSSLKEACVKFTMYRGNLKSLMKTADFEYLRRSCPALVNEFLAKVVS
jgi:speckle-type POZ protein